MELVPFDALYPEDARFDEIEKILGFIKEGNSSQVIGLPGVGRANLLGFLAQNQKIRKKHLGDHEKNFHFVLINFSEVKKRPLADITKLIFLTLADSIKAKHMSDTYETVHDIFKESLSYHDELILFQGLKKTIDILAIEQQLTVVFLFERFEEYIPTLTSDFFTNLRILRNRAKYHFSVVFSLNRPLEELIEPVMMADFYEFIAGHSVYLPISDAPGNAFRIEYLEKATGKELDKNMRNFIVEYTGGHGKLTRICVEIVLGNSQFSVSQSANWKLSDFLAHPRVRGALYEIWYALSPLEQKCLTSSHPCNHDEPCYLDMVGLCHNGEIAIPLLEAFVKQLTNTQQEEKIVFNPETGSIVKGDFVLSDKLTVSEFRLLHYLLENGDKILEKEEIIQAVWKDAKTTAGVTDQALDQLIFRLRKKIEDDPNNPLHIITIKGRGIKFTP